MAETGKTPRRSKAASARKPAAKRAAKPVEKKQTAGRPAATEDKALDTVAELTAADLTTAGENSPAKPTKVPAEAAKQIETAAKQSIDQTQDKAEAVAVAEDVKEGAEEVGQKGTEVMADVMENTKKYADETKERLESAFSDMSERTKVNVEKSTKAMEELGDITKGNVEALMESGKIASKGMEAMGQEAAEYSRQTFEKASSAMKSLAAAKSPTEFFQLQSELFSSHFDSFAKETAKNSEAMLKLASDVVQPISTRVSVVTEKVRSLSA